MGVAVAPDSAFFFFFLILGLFGFASGTSPNISSVLPKSSSSVGPLAFFFFFTALDLVFFLAVELVDESGVAEVAVSAGGGGSVFEVGPGGT